MVRGMRQPFFDCRVPRLVTSSPSFQLPPSHHLLAPDRLHSPHLADASHGQEHAVVNRTPSVIPNLRCEIPWALARGREEIECVLELAF